MPCNLAVSIAKAGVTQPQLLALLTPDVVKQVVLAYLEQQYASSKPSVICATRARVVLRMGTCVVSIENGSVRVTDSQGNQAFIETLATEVERLLLLLADRLFQQKLQETLGPLLTQVQNVSVNNDGQMQQATVFSLNI